jgi:hypothetical protein
MRAEAKTRADHCCFSPPLIMSSSEPAPRPSAIHRLQVQAFLDAAEDVDVDEETIEDLLEGCEDEEPHAHDAELRPDAEEAFEPEENDGFDDPEYLALVEECEFRWSTRISVKLRWTNRSLSQRSMVSSGNEGNEAFVEGEGYVAQCCICSMLTLDTRHARVPARICSFAKNTDTKAAVCLRCRAGTFRPSYYCTHAAHMYSV